MAKYKFALSPRVKGMTEWNLEHYHEYKKSIEQYKNDMVPSQISKYPYKHEAEDNKASSVGMEPNLVRSTETSRPTEQCGMRIATSPFILHTECSIRAVEKALDMCDDTDRKLIDLVYWKRAYTITGAAMRLGLTKTPAYNRVNNILCFIALELGYVSI